jgi:quercetin dioxygenase-like cupin family protein
MLKIALRTITITLLSATAFNFSVQAQDHYPPVQKLLASSRTIIGQNFEYPGGEPAITAAVVTMLPGHSTGWHEHDAPLFAWVLEGEITVDYGPDGQRVYAKDDAFVEAFRSAHNGINSGDGIARILAVFSGSHDVKDTVMEDEIAKMKPKPIPE